MQSCCLTVAPTCELVGKYLVWAWAVGQQEQQSGRRAGINWNLALWCVCLVEMQDKGLREQLYGSR